MSAYLKRPAGRERENDSVLDESEVALRIASGDLVHAPIGDPPLRRDIVNELRARLKRRPARKRR
jgi:hypothetical protein